jgi:uncharacterized membrane protein
MRIRIYLFSVLFLVFGVFSMPVLAQSIFPTEPTEKVEEKSSIVTDNVPRVFSSRLENVTLAENLDKTYADLQKYLWLIYQSDKTRQEILLELLVAEKFQYTRRMAEFKKPLDEAMMDLNKNSKRMRQQIADADAAFQDMKGSFQGEERKASELWAKKKKEFEEFSEKYLQSQGKFLNTYFKLVSFIMADAGSYYYDGQTRRVAFYNVEGYTFFANKIDELNKIVYNQKTLLRDIRPIQEN